MIGSDNKHKLKQIIAFAQQKTLVTVADTLGFGEEGVIINFVVADDRIRFEVNKTQLDRSEITISYKLLQMALDLN